MPLMVGTLKDLNDLHFYAAVVEHQGFSAAGRALGIPKSRLSKRVAQLEERLGVRLLQRTTRKFVVTETGERFYAHCCAVLEEARSAQEAIDALRAEPHGVVRVSCPVSLARSMLAPVLPDFLAQYPKVQVRLLASNRRVDLIGEGYDIAIRVRFGFDTDATHIVREFGSTSMVLVASKALWERHAKPQSPADLAALPVVSMNEQEGPQSWDLVHVDGGEMAVTVSPRLVTGEFAVLLEAAERGTGVALLPETFCACALSEGRLERLLPEWSGPQGTMHFVYPSRRGLLPGVRALVDFLAERLGSPRETLIES